MPVVLAGRSGVIKAAVDDRRTSIDVVIIRESLRNTCGSIRWLPTDRMLADGLTKDTADPVDFLRACIRKSAYQISPIHSSPAASGRKIETSSRQGKQHQGVFFEFISRVAPSLLDHYLHVWVAIAHILNGCECQLGSLLIDR